MGKRLSTPAESGATLKQHQLDSIMEGDCIAAMNALPAGSVDLLFADPPYNLQLNGDLHRPDNSRVDGVEEDWDKFGGFAEYDHFTAPCSPPSPRWLPPTAPRWGTGRFNNIFRFGPT